MSDNVFPPDYRECEHSLFISHAHDDETATNDFVKGLGEAIFRVLHGLPRNITKLGTVATSRKPIVSGVVSEKLKDRMKKSFGVLLVVGANYVSSEWCEQELKFFEEIYGKDAVRDRLFVAVISKAAYAQAQQGPQWQRLGVGDVAPLYMCRSDDANRAMSAWRGDGGFDPAFFENVESMVEDLKETIIGNVQRSKERVQLRKTEVDERRPVQQTVWSNYFHSPKMAIAPCTDDLINEVKKLQAFLDKKGFKADILAKEKVAPYDPEGVDNERELREELAKYDVLIAPISSARPFRPEKAGGHLSILREEWSRLRKASPIIWYHASGAAPAVAASQTHLDVFANLAPACASEEAVADLLLGPENPVKIYIEHHPGVFQYYRLATRLEMAWRELPDADRLPKLTCEMLQFSDLESAAKDASGVVLMLPQGLKSKDSLQAQQKTVREVFKASGAVAGCVAVIFKNNSQIADWGTWPLVEFVNSPASAPSIPALAVDEASKPWLEEFLTFVLFKHSEKISAAAVN